MKHTLLFSLFAAAAAALPAKVVLQPVPYEHNGVKLQGWLAFDDTRVSSEKVPGVLVVPEWWGLNDYVKRRARQLAELGYVAFVADMYGAGISTTDPKKAGELASPFYGKPLMPERTRAGLDQLLKNEHVDSARVAAIGYCFGGAAVQTLAYAGAPIAGIVSFHGSLVPASAEAAANNHAKFLICHGGADPFTTKDARDAFLDSLEQHHLDYQFVIYAHALHAFTNPDADRAAANGLKGVGYNAAADRRSWAQMKLFFTEIFGERK